MNNKMKMTVRLKSKPIVYTVRYVEQIYALYVGVPSTPMGYKNTL